jgi:hypothetical protein
MQTTHSCPLPQPQQRNTKSKERNTASSTATTTALHIQRLSQPRQTWTSKPHHGRAHQLAFCTAPRLLDPDDNSLVLLACSQQVRFAAIGSVKFQVSAFQLRDPLKTHVETPTLLEQRQAEKREGLGSFCQSQEVTVIDRIRDSLLLLLLLLRRGVLTARTKPLSLQLLPNPSQARRRPRRSGQSKWRRPCSSSGGNLSLNRSKANCGV